MAMPANIAMYMVILLAALIVQLPFILSDCPMLTNPSCLGKYHHGFLTALAPYLKRDKPTDTTLRYGRARTGETRTERPQARRQQMYAKTLMTRPVHTIRENATIGEAADIMSEYKISALPVVDAAGRLTGILTHTDFGLRRLILPHGETAFTMMGFWTDPGRMNEAIATVREKIVRDVMSTPVTTIEEDTPMEEVVKLMMEKRINRLPVMRETEIVGIITRHDLIKLLGTEGALLSAVWESAR
jgi:CBS domain-containing protein